MKKLGIGILILLLPAITNAEHQKKPADPKVVQALQLASAAAAPLRGVDRAYAYWLLARSYQDLDAKEELKMVKESCESAITAQPDAFDLGLRNKIETDCLRRMLVLAPKAGEEMVRRADSDVRQQILAAKVISASKKGSFDDALTMLTSEVASGANYPYASAIQLLKSLPAERRDDKDRIFSQAISTFMARKPRFDVGGDDIGTMIAKCWREVSPGLVMEAIDRVLDAAGSENNAESHLEVSIGSPTGAASFKSLYQYRLFQLVPVLQEFDPGKAKSLLETNPRTGSALKSMADSEGPSSINLHIGSGPAATGEASGDDLLRIRLENQAEEILASFTAGPDTALMNAKLLPDYRQLSRSVKCDLLLALARQARQGHESIAIAALEAAQDTIKDLSVLAQSRYLVETAEQYIQLGRGGLAEEEIKRGLRNVKILYDDDVNSDDPNRALKSSWPSTVVARAFVAMATRISQKTAEQTIKDLPDPDLQAFARIEQASVLLKRVSYPALMQSIHKAPRSSSAEPFPMPHWD